MTAEPAPVASLSGGAAPAPEDPAPEDPAPEDPGTEDWERRYRERRTGWDLGGAPPALVRAVARWSGMPGGVHPRRLRVLVPGAGFGHDAFAWARAGHQVTAVDLAPSACAALARCAQRAGLSVRVVCSDVLALPSAFHGTFELAWEQTCFCALPPDRRPEYVRALADALAPGGHLLALLWHHGLPGGPPHDVDWADVRASFLGRFKERSVEAVPDSVPGRSHEFLVTLERR